MFWFYMTCKILLLREMSRTIIASKNHYKCIRVSVLGLHASKVWDKLTNFKNAPLFITSVGAKFNSLGNSFRHSYLPCATFAHLCNFHFRSLPASCFYYLCTTCVLPGTFTFIHYLPTSLLLHIWPNIFKKNFEQNFWTTYATAKIV